MPDETPLVVYRDRVRAEWVDYNRHLRDAFYLLLFSYATDVLIERIGLDDAARTARGEPAAEAQILSDAQMRKEMRILKDEADASPVRRHEDVLRDIGQHMAIDDDMAGIGALQSGDERQCRRFARA